METMTCITSLGKHLRQCSTKINCSYTEEDNVNEEEKGMPDIQTRAPHLMN